MKALFALLLAGVIVPAPGSALRKAVLDGLRPAVERKLGPNVEFKIAVIRVEGDWAFVVADPQRKGGRPIDGRKLFGEDFENMDGFRIDAVLKRRGGKWTVAEYGIGATDVWYCDIGPRSIKRGYGC